MRTPRDRNSIPVTIATSNTDGVTLFSLVANPTTHRLIISTGSTGTDLGTSIVKRDENSITGIEALNSSNNTTPVPVFINSGTKRLLTA